MKSVFVPKCFQCSYPLAFIMFHLDFIGSKSKTVTCPRCGLENLR